MDVPKRQINNIPALVQIMAWRRTGDKPSSEPMIVRLLTHKCGLSKLRCIVGTWFCVICLIVDKPHQWIHVIDLPNWSGWI